MTCALWFVFGILMTCLLFFVFLTLMTCALCFVFEYVNDLRALFCICYIDDLRALVCIWYINDPRALVCICYVNDLRALFQVVFVTLETLRSDNGDVHEKVTEKYTSHPFKPFRDFHKPPCHLKERNLGWNWRGGPRPSSDRDGGIKRLQFPSLKKLKIWSFQVVVVQRRQRNVQKSVMHVQSCCFAN